MHYQKTFQQSEPPAKKLLSCHTYIGNEDSYYSSRHCHLYYEISYIVRGSRYETLNQNKYKVEAGSLIFIPPLAIHSQNNITKVDDIVIQFDHLFIRNSSMLFENNYMLKASRGQEKTIRLNKSDNLHKIFLLIRDYCRKRDSLAGNDEKSQMEKISIDLKINSLCLDIISSLITKKKIYVDEKGAVYSDIDKINTLINDLFLHPEKNISMQEASKIAGMSYSNFSRSFKKITGFNYMNFCNLLRIRHAEELLLTTDMPVSEITEAVGLETTAYFTKLFKQINGDAPNHYRKKYI